MNDQQLLRYSRHIMLSEIDIEGQERLLESHVLIVGLGGLGCPAALYLASSGVGRLTLSDYDTVDLSNLQRQIAYDSNDIGRLKTDVLKEKIHALNPDVHVSICKPIHDDTLNHLPHSVNVVLDCSDNFLCRYQLNRWCVTVKIPLVSGTIVQFGGQISTFAPHQGSPCYQCLYPEQGREPLACAENGVAAPAAGVIGTMQALEALKLITQAGNTLLGKLLLFDALKMQYHTLTVHADPCCSICNTQSA